jgi:xylulokinase
MGPAFGAARLGRVAASGESIGACCAVPTVDRVVEPDPQIAARSAPRYELYKRLYAALRESFSALDPAPQ